MYLKKAFKLRQNINNLHVKLLFVRVPISFLLIEHFSSWFLRVIKGNFICSAKDRLLAPLHTILKIILAFINEIYGVASLVFNFSTSIDSSSPGCRLLYLR